MSKRRYTYSELVNGQYSIDDTRYVEIYGEEHIFCNRICEVNTEKQAKKLLELLNQ